MFSVKGYEYIETLGTEITILDLIDRVIYGLNRENLAFGLLLVITKVFVTVNYNIIYGK